MGMRRKKAQEEKVARLKKNARPMKEVR